MPTPAGARKRPTRRRATAVKPPPKRRRPAWQWAALVVGLAVIVGGVIVGLQNTSSGTVASPSKGAIDGITCDTSEHALFHIHAHLAVYANGAAQPVPYGIGIAPPLSIQQNTDGPFVTGGSCLYWLHTHTGDGIIHIESPVQRTFTLGDFYDIWGQPLSATQVGGAKGAVIASINGQRYSGDPRSIPLIAHAVIQLDVGQDVAPQPYTFAQGL